MNNSHWLTDYDPSNEEFWNKKGKKIGIAYELENGEIIYVPE